MAQSSAVFLDTSWWIAFLNKDDEWHEKALLLMEDIHQSGRTLVTTEAPDGPAFLRKFAICYRDIFAPDADRPDAAAHLLIDAQRLLRA